MNNAVTHGCHGDPARYVRCMVRLKGRQLTIAIHDDGEGFDWRGALGRLAAASATSGRGIEILRKYATRVRFNASGNAVTIIRRF